MQFKGRKLPILQCSKNKSTFIKDRSKIQDLIMENARNRATHKDYRHEEDFSQIKATNFLSRVESVDSPQVIFTIADQIKQISSTMLKQNQCSKAEIELKKELLCRSQIRRLNEQRQQALNLGRWMDDKLKKFKAKTSITFMDILQYKQNILNYALGRIIDSLTKKCKEQGQLLSLIWNNTFVMFEGVFNILVDANKQKEKEKITQAKQLHGIYQVNHNFLREENLALSQQNKAIFEKMRNVIVWNKRLRKDRKQLFTRNRVLEYRLQTYTQSLQQTVQMLLQSVAEPATIQTAKNIIQKLGKQRNRKRNFYKRESDEEFSTNVKELVYNWLKNNSYLNQDILNFMNQFSNKKEDYFIFQELKDHNQMKKVDIYDFFKLYDIGVQASAELKSEYTQIEHKVYRNAEIMTKGINTIEHSCQTVGKFEFKPKVDQIEEKRSIFTKPRQNTRTKENIVREKSKKKTRNKEIVSQKSFNNLKGNRSADLQYQKMQEKQLDKQRHRPRGSNVQHSYQVKLQKLTEEDQYAHSKLLETNSVALEQGRRYDRVIKRRKSQFQNSSVTDYLQEENQFKDIATKHLITNNSFKGRQKSMRDFPEQYSGSSRNIALIKKRRERKSLTYGMGNSVRKSTVRLNLKKKFNQAYRENRQFMKNNSEQFFDQIVRRRSFFMKKRVEFASFQAAEETTQKIRDYLRGNKPFHNYFKSFYQNANYVSSNIQKLSKKFSAPTNISKTKILLSAQNVFTSITTTIQNMARLPPKNKVFVNNSLSMITKYIQELIPDYLKQIRRQKQDLASNDCEKALYPLNILLMERMTFKYGLKDIAEKKIKNFIEKVLTFAPVSQKVGLYSILLGLQDQEVGSDELLVYLKCLVYFDYKKGLREVSNIDSSKVDLDIVHENLRKILQYFFDHQYINLVELKLEMYFQHNALTATVEGIAIIIVKELLKRKKDLKQKYSKIHQICSYGDNFYTNAFNMLKIYSNYHIYAEKEAELDYKYSKKGNQNAESVEALQKIRRRQKGKKTEFKPDPTAYDIGKISSIIRELLQRSDIIDEQYGKSITPERFVTAAVICGVPAFHEFQKVLIYLKGKFVEVKQQNPIYDTINCSDWRGVQKLQRLWGKSSVGRSEDPAVNSWSISKLYADKIEEEVVCAMGMLGTVGLYLQSSLFNLGIES